MLRALAQAVVTLLLLKIRFTAAWQLYDQYLVFGAYTLAISQTDASVTNPDDTTTSDTWTASPVSMIISGPSTTKPTHGDIPSGNPESHIENSMLVELWQNKRKRYGILACIVFSVFVIAVVAIVVSNDGNKCDQCSFCQCDENCDCICTLAPKDGNKCDQCTSCECDDNCACIGDKCDQCNFCQCDENCDCIPCTTTRCGRNWSLANTNCGANCVDESGCMEEGYTCYADLTTDLACCAEANNHTFSLRITDAADAFDSLHVACLYIVLSFL